MSQVENQLNLTRSVPEFAQVSSKESFAESRSFDGSNIRAGFIHSAHSGAITDFQAVLSPQSEINGAKSQNATLPPDGPDDKKSRVRYGWDVMFSALLGYGEEFGTCNVPRRYQCSLPEGTVSPDNKPIFKACLGSWVTTQRIEKQSGRLSASREYQLQTLVDRGLFDWNPLNYLKLSEKSWPHMFKCLETYLEQRISDGCRDIRSIPEKFKWVHPDGYEVGLGRWMHTQNKRRRLGQLRPDRLAQIQALVDAGKFRWPTPRGSSVSGDSISGVLHDSSVSQSAPPSVDTLPRVTKSSANLSQFCIRPSSNRSFNQDAVEPNRENSPSYPTTDFYYDYLQGRYSIVTPDTTVFHIDHKQAAYPMASEQISSSSGTDICAEKSRSQDSSGTLVFSNPPEAIYQPRCVQSLLDFSVGKRVRCDGLILNPQAAVDASDEHVFSLHSDSQFSPELGHFAQVSQTTDLEDDNFGDLDVGEDIDENEHKETSDSVVSVDYFVAPKKSKSA